MMTGRWKMKWMLVGAAVLAGILTTSAQAQETTVAEFLNKHRRAGETWRTVTMYWMDGFIGGVVASSVHAELNGRAIICPGDVTIGQEFVIQNMERLVREEPRLQNTMWQIVAFRVLREAFPCK